MSILWFDFGSKTMAYSVSLTVSVNIWNTVYHQIQQKYQNMLGIISFQKKGILKNKTLSSGKNNNMLKYTTAYITQ